MFNFKFIFSLVVFVSSSQLIQAESTIENSDDSYRLSFIERASKYTPPLVSKLKTGDLKSFRSKKQKLLFERSKLLHIREQDELSNAKKTLQKRPIRSNKVSTNLTKTIDAKSFGVHSSAQSNSLTSRFVSDWYGFSASAYVNNMNLVYLTNFSAPAGASSISISFSRIDIESNYDRIYVYDYDGILCDSISGYYPSGKIAVQCSGSYAEVYVSTDGSNSGADGYAGFSIDGYYYQDSFINSPPVAIATADGYSNADGEYVSFSGSSSYDPDQGDSIRSYFWEFGDGYTSTSRSVSHRYANPGVYTVYLTVTDQYGSSSYDWLSVEVRQTPAPSAFRVRGTTGRSVSLAWEIYYDHDEDYSGFKIYYSLGNISNVSCGGSDIYRVTSYRLSQLQPETQYTIALCTYNRYGRFSEPSVVRVRTPAITYPPKPTSLSLTDIKSHSMRLNWKSAGENTDTFVVGINQGSQAPSCSSATNVDTALSKLYTNLLGGTNYSFVVCAVNSDGDFSVPSTISQSTNPIVYPPTPINLNVSGLFANRFTFNWESAGANTFSFVVAMTTGRNAPSCSSGSNVGLSTLKQYTKLQGDTDYALAVCAVNDEGDMSPPSQFFVRTPPTPPSPPQVTNLVASTIGVNQVTINWTSGGGSTLNYRVASNSGSVAANCSANGTLVGTSTNFSFAGLRANSKYTFSVCALNNIDVSGPIASITVSTLNPATPPNPTKVSVSATNNSVSASWTSGGGSTNSYRLAIAPGSNAPSNCNSGQPTQSASFTFSGLAAFTKYSVRICAVNALGTMSSGFVKSVTTLDNPSIDVSGFRVSGASSKTLTLSWDYSGTNVGGQFVIKSSSAGTVTPPANCSGGKTVALTGRSYTFKNLLPQKNYAFRICSENGNKVRTLGVTTSGIVP